MRDVSVEVLRIKIKNVRNDVNVLLGRQFNEEKRTVFIVSYIDAFSF